MNRTALIVLTVLVVLALALVAWAALRGSDSTPAASPESQQGTSPDTGTTPDPEGPATTDTIQLALLDTEGVSSGPQRGCDRVVMVTRRVPSTQAPLTAALNELFALEATTVSGWHNFIARTNDTLSFERAEVENGTARVYLTGSLSGLAGVCDDPRTRTQIEETALQFPTVDRVEIYLNGERTDLTPDERGA